MGSDPSSSENGFTLMAFSGWAGVGVGGERGIVLCRSIVPHVCSTTLVELGQVPKQAGKQSTKRGSPSLSTKPVAKFV